MDDTIAAIVFFVFLCIIIAKPLVDHKAHAECQFSQTPIFYAIKHGQLTVVKTLIRLGANVNPQAYEKNTPLIWAAKYGHTDIIRFLCDHGANVDAVDLDGKTALHWAAKYGHTDIISVLCDHGANVDALEDVYGRTALHYAVHKNWLLAALSLLEKSANTESQNKLFLTPMHIAACHNNTHMIKLLYDHKADIDATDENGVTPLMNAVHCASHTAVKYLIDLGANVDKRHVYNETALHVAVSKQDGEMVEIMILRHVPRGDVPASDLFDLVTDRTLLCEYNGAWM